MPTLVFQNRKTGGESAVCGAAGAVVATIRRHWTGTSFTVAAAGGGVLCTVDRGGLVSTRWSAVEPDGEPLLVFTSAGRGGLITFVDGRTARLKRQSAGPQWIIRDGRDNSVLGIGRPKGSRWHGEGRRLEVQTPDNQWSLAEIVAVVQSYRLDDERRTRSNRLRWAYLAAPH